jgi:hypothetical protein
VGFRIEFAPVFPTLARNDSPFKAGINNITNKVFKHFKCWTFIQIGSHWPKKQLTYKIKNYTEDMPKSDVDREIARGFQMWADVADLTFVHVDNELADVDINIM